MTEQDYSNDLVFRSNGEEYARIDGSKAWKQDPPAFIEIPCESTGLKLGAHPASIIFNTSATNEIARFTEEGFYYKGEFIEDAGEVYRLLKDVLNDICYKQLCIELLAALENEGWTHWETPPDEDSLCLRARVALGI